MDDHHLAGRANSPVTIPVPTNDHRAVLSIAQYDWPTETLENPTRNELLKAAGSLRGFLNYHDYVIDKLIRPLPEALETLAKKERRMTAKNKRRKTEEK